MTSIRESMQSLPPGDVAVAQGSVLALLRSIPADPAAAAEQAAAALGKAIGADVSVALFDDSQRWTTVAGPSHLPDGMVLTELLSQPDTAACDDVAVVIVARAAAVAQVGGGLPGRLRALAEQVCTWLALAVEQTSAIERERVAGAEAVALRAVIQQVLSVRDLDQVLLSISDRTLHLLDADLCGVLLKEGDELRMRSCVGNRVVETGRLRMSRGQGVAGLVFVTGQPAKVDDYLRDRTISQDFVTLAEQEQTRSALAVPLSLQGEFLGVLEVWRRRPSLFTEQDVARLVALADVATIAIKNAWLYAEQARAMAELVDVRDALEEQISVLRWSSTLQRTLLDAVLEGADLAAIARTVVASTGCQIGIYGPEGERIAHHRAGAPSTDLPATLCSVGRSGCTTVALESGAEVRVWVQPVVADGDKLGCVCLLPGSESPVTMEVVTGQVAMACSLTLLRQRAASRARAQALEQVLWDLLQGPVEHRVAARSRARQMGVRLSGSLRVLYGRLENVGELAVERGWDTSHSEKVRRDVLRAIEAADTAPGLVLAAVRGDWIVAIVRGADRDSVKDLASRMTTASREAVLGVRLTWGVSRTGTDPVELPRSFDEANTALSAAHRLGGEGIFLYEELGIVRLLLGSGDDPDLQTFIRDVTGPLIDYDRENNGALVRTLRMFFDANCSQKLAAERLFIHHKTLRYRLDQIKQHTGLDLSRHDDRMRADVALRLLLVGEPTR